jgi:hypothetical protein
MESASWRAAEAAGDGAACQLFSAGRLFHRVGDFLVPLLFGPFPFGIERFDETGLGIPTGNNGQSNDDQIEKGFHQRGNRGAGLRANTISTDPAQAGTGAKGSMQSLSAASGGCLGNPAGPPWSRRRPIRG